MKKKTNRKDYNAEELSHFEVFVPYCGFRRFSGVFGREYKMHHNFWSRLLGEENKYVMERS
jgi:hypothetical protein